MAHNLYKRLDGTYAALYVGKSAWHGLGEVIDDAQTAKQIYERVFDKRVITLEPAYARIKGRYVEVPATRFTVDRKTGQVFAPVSATYQPIQDLSALGILERIPKVTKRTAAFVSAGRLGDGARGFATLDLTRFIGEKALTVLRDTSKMEAFLFATWSHDGTGALIASDAINRVDCQNMLNAATASAERRGRLVRILHSGSERTIEDQIEEAQRILGFAVESTKANVKLLNQLADIALPKPDQWFRDFTELVVPIPEDMERKGGREETRQLLRELWQQSPTLVGVPKSPYRGYQVVAEYADHFRPLRVGEANANIVPEKRFRSITEGPGADMKAHALELIKQEFEVKVKVPAR